jgi:CBS domain containing-hemolysin-like protein
MKVVCLHKDEFLYKGLTFPYRGITFLFLSNLSFSGAHYRIAMHRSTKQYELYLDAASLQSSTQNITIMEISSKGAAHMLLPPKKTQAQNQTKLPCKWLNISKFILTLTLLMLLGEEKTPSPLRRSSTEEW